MDLTEIMGKKDKKVPVLLKPSIRDTLDLFNSMRSICRIPDTIPSIHVFAKNKKKRWRWTNPTVKNLKTVEDHDSKKKWTDLEKMDLQALVASALRQKKIHRKRRNQTISKTDNYIGIKNGLDKK